MKNIDRHKKSLDILDNFLSTTPKEEIDEFLKSFSSGTVPEENPEYNIALNKLTGFPQFYIGQQVVTNIGIGIITTMDIPSNGLTIYPERTVVTVWFGTGSKNGIISKEFPIMELID